MAVADFDCGTVKSQENPSGARARRNVLKLGHSLREGVKVPVHKCVSARQDLSFNSVYKGMSVRMYMCYTGQYAASIFISMTASHRKEEACDLFFLVIKRFRLIFSSLLWTQISCSPAE